MPKPNPLGGRWSDTAKILTHFVHGHPAHRRNRHSLGLGAQRSNVWKLVLAQGAALTAAGIAIGIAASAALLATFLSITAPRP
jgi:hypothetical protein